MKYINDPTLKFPRRPFFEMSEIEGVTERILQDAGFPRVGTSAAIDIDRVLMKLHLEPSFEKLEDGVLGVTFFSADGAIRMVISDGLEADARRNPISELRLRTTQAHELGHVALHKELYVNHTPSLFDEPAPEPMLCREEGLRSAAYNGEWWEFQANVAMAALLMPRAEFVKLSADWARRQGIASPSVIRDERKYAGYVAHLADLFQVSKEATRLRAEALGMGFSREQRQLGI